MIKIYKKEDCCGCSACVHICPKHSISFKEDSEGFLYPHVDLKTCVDCGLCEKVCPVLNQNDERLPLQTFAAKHRDDEVRMKSSSGGVFTLLAEQIIDAGGVVFGARFNDKWEVIHDFTDTKEGLAPFRGSKYVQSNIGESYKQVADFLKEGRKVLFTGTPCQVAGLKKYLRKDYDNLLTVDFICHGVPSPMVWRKYLDEEINRQCPNGSKAFLTGVNFRDKCTGWKTFSFVLNFNRVTQEGMREITISSIAKDNAYMDAFISNMSLRPSCHACPAKSGVSGADITIGDFWGSEIEAADFDDEIGVSLFLINNHRVQKSLNTNMFLKEIGYEQVLRMNSAIIVACSAHPLRNVFMRTIRVLGFRKSFFFAKSSNLFIRILRRFILLYENSNLNSTFG